MDQVIPVEGVVVELELVEFGDGDLAEGGYADKLVVTEGQLSELGHFHRPQPLGSGDFVPVCVKGGVLSQIWLRLRRGDKSTMMWSLLSAGLGDRY